MFRSAMFNILIIVALSAVLAGKVNTLMKTTINCVISFYSHYFLIGDHFFVMLQCMVFLLFSSLDLHGMGTLSGMKH